MGVIYICFHISMAEWVRVCCGWRCLGFCDQARLLVVDETLGRVCEKAVVIIELFSTVSSCFNSISLTLVLSHTCMQVCHSSPCCSASAAVRSESDRDSQVQLRWWTWLSGATGRDVALQGRTFLKLQPILKKAE